MKNGLKKGLSVACLLLMVGGGILWWFREGLPLHCVRARPAMIAPVAPVTPVAALQNKLPEQDANPLNLALPQPPLLMDPKIELPGKSQDLKNLFTQPAPEPSVKVGGHLILKETPPEPNAAIWDQVKGAEVGITIKTP